MDDCYYDYKYDAIEIYSWKDESIPTLTKEQIWRKFHRSEAVGTQFFFLWFLVPCVEHQRGFLYDVIFAMQLGQSIV